MSSAPRRLIPDQAVRWIRVPETSDDKYTRGVVGLRTGSHDYPGAAVLGVEAAWATGVGMVRYVPPSDAPTVQALAPAALVLARRPETVLGAGRSDAWVVGSGADPARSSAADRAAIMALFAGDTPLVVDAGALELLVAHGVPRAPTVLTPHGGELARLFHMVGIAEPVGLHDRGPRDDDTLSASLRALADRLGATILLKGSVTRVVSPDGLLCEVGPATPWLATAGTGDVLAGVLGALVAQHAASVREDPSLLRELGGTAALLHDVAARLASGDVRQSSHLGLGIHSSGSGTHPGTPITALQVAAHLSTAVGLLLEGEAVPVVGFTPADAPPARSGA